MRVISYLCFLGCLSLAPSALAQNSAPLELTAGNALEWHRASQKFIATGGVTAVQGEITLKAANMSATYAEGVNGDNFALQTLNAENGVTIDSPDGTASGGQLSYDVNTGEAVMSGGDLALIAEGTTVTAQERFIYNVPGGRLSAVGEALAVQQTENGENRVAADSLAALFSEEDTEDGERQLKELQAIGRVIITTPTEIITGQRGVYRRADQTAELTGDVTITRGENVLSGARVTVDLSTGLSKLYGGTDRESGASGRVRGVFYPESN